MITLSEICKKMGTRTLFEGVTITFNDSCRYGLTGPNGAGKSTLMKIIMGVEPATSGSVSLPKKIGFLKQNIADFLEYKVVDTVIMGNDRLWAALEERDQLYEQEITDEIGMRLGELEEVIADEDGYSAESNAEVLLEGMGICSEYFSKQMKELPTDQQFKVLLCQALFGEPEALLLDEPTNHLDLESIKWLEGFLHGYQGCLIVISHDRHFLNAVTNHIADIDYDTIIVYPGNYDQMVIAKASVRQSAEDENKAKEKKISQLREFVSKFSAGTRASQVQSRLREIERLQTQDLKKSNIQRPYIRFYPPEKQAGQVVIKAENLSKSYDELEVIKNLSFEIHRGDKIGVIGNNGRGKSTLLKMLAGVLEPSSGTISTGHQVEAGYFPQDHKDVIDKNTKESAFDWLKARKETLYDQDVRSILGKMLFAGDDAFKEINHLSGGETARVLIGGLMLSNPNFLIMDEPNNHLDLEAVSALAWGLEDFKGTAIVASHDRDLLNRFATKLIAFEADGIRVFDGKLDEYLEQVQTS